ncbi:unnamed protein product, partial [Durusdinium trenchii]
MATMMEKKEQVATWNGDPTTWLEYVKRVRLQFERTEKKRRCLLGAELASRLTGRAWDIVSAEVDHSQLQKRDGAAYLLRFLEERLCKAPVPDTGQRLEDFFLRLRRTPGSSMAEWATQVRESYRRLQRAMARQRKDLADRDGQLRERAMFSTHSNPGHRRQSDVTTPKAPTASVESASPGFPATDSGNGQTDRPDDPRETDEPDRGAYERVPTQDPGSDAGNDWWTQEEWDTWRRRNRHWRRDDAMSWTAWEEDEEEDPVIEWEQFDLGSERILPDEILGWILLRRSGRPANARMHIGACCQKLTLKMLMTMCFGLANDFPPDVYSAPADESSAWSTWLPDGQELSWEWHEDDFYASDAAGIFWSWSETKTWLDMCDAPTSDGDPLQEAYAAFQDRFRTFKESRALNSAKHLSRGFYPLGQMKGKFMQAKGKGKGKSKTKNPPNSSLATSTAALYAGGAKGAPSGQKPGSPTYKGCFVCGSQDHDFRRCPKRQSSSSTGAPARSLYAAAVFMVSSEQADEIADVTFPTGDVLATLAAQFPGHAVLDSGATESIASLEAMHEVMELRASIHGPEHFVVHAQQKRFRFGNGSIQNAVSFVELPQIVAGKHVKLGVHALDAPGIPLLLSVKTLTTLRAVIDFDEGLICFKEVDPSVWIKLKRASNGHLLLDLTKDWLSDRPDSCLTVHDLHDSELKHAVRFAICGSCYRAFFDNLSSKLFDSKLALATTPVPKTTTKKKGTRVPTPEKYDVSRREGPDGRDSRAQGFPCYGNHTPMPEGRGSLSGRNGHGKWTVCTLCRLRIEYVPAYGAKGCYRQPGPLAPDVTTVMEQVKDDIKDKPEVRENLNMKMASTLGAEASLRKKLEVLENDKHELDRKRSRIRGTGDSGVGESDTISRKAVRHHITDETYDTEDPFGQIYGKLTPLQQESLMTSADHYQQEAEETFEVLFNTSSQVDLMEVRCPPDSRLSQTFLDNNRKAIRVGLPAHDLSNSKDTEEIIAMIHDLRPKMMWISLPCGPYSPIQHIFNQATPEQEAALLLKKKRSRKLTRNALRLVKTQLEEGGHVCWEWPQNNGGWRLPELKVLYDLMNQFKETHHAHIHGCAFGVKNAVGMPLKKPWKVVCTSPSMAAALTRRCPGNREHAECIGGQDARNSGFYPEAMRRTIFRTVQSMNHSLDGGAFAESFPIFDDTLMEDEKELNLEKPLSDSERKMAMQTLAKLHRRTGHPSNHALSGCLKHRGAHHEVIEMAKKYQCPECQELRLAELNPSGALQRSDTLWETLVLDNAEMTVDNQVIHCMIMMDEASRLVCPHYLFQHEKTVSRNCTGFEAMQAIEETWIRHYGNPAAIRLDPEGAFKSSELAQWAAERGIEVLPCAAEARQQISVVERMIQTVKNTVKQLLQSGEFDAWSAIIHACRSHNEGERIEGFTPFQWAFGRMPTLSGSFHEKSPDLPFWTSSGVPGSAMAVNLKQRVMAQNVFMKNQAFDQITRAANAKTRRHQIFLPGDLVFFKRIKPPAQPQASVRMAHKLWRWYGPARVLASETRTDAHGAERKPSHIVWIVSHGRLKRCAPEQLRHASEREKTLAEHADSPTASWTFHGLTKTLYKGEYEILDKNVFPEDLDAQGPPRERRVSLSRLARDPRYTPEPVPKPRTVPELFEQPIFKKQRRLHQGEDEAMMVSDTMTTPMEDLADYACVLYLDLPSKANEWRKMRRTPINYFVKKVRGAEIQRHKLDPTEKKKFMEAKHLEVQQWLTASAVKRITGDVKSAFLQGDPDEADRALYARPVPELAEALHMKENEVVQVLKSCYGLVNAPANWYLCIRRTLAELNFTQSRSDPCLWFYYMETGDPERPKELAGYICSHVDDFIISGNEECEQWVEALQAFHGRFRWSPWEHQNFLHCGIRIREEPDSSFTLDHSAYCEAIEQITYTTKNEHEPLTKDEMSQLRGALGALQWRAQQTAPHLMARLGQLQSSITKANIETIKATNKLIRENFQHRYLSARINQLGVEDPRSVHFVAWSDAALANRIDLSSTGGFLIAATSEKMLLGERAPLTLVSWRSSRLARKARSSLAAETQAMSEADQELLFVRLAWAEFCAFEVDLKASEKAISQIPGTVVTDAKALFDILLKSDLNSAAAGLRDKYSALEVLCLLESLAKLGTKARWVHSDQQLADHLTKPLPAGTLHKVLSE